VGLAATGLLAALVAGAVLLAPPEDAPPGPRGLRQATPATARPCDPVPVYAAGQPLGPVCAEEAAGRGLTVLSLADDWLPVLFSETADRPQPIRSRLVELANERLRGRAHEQARRDRYFELHGIFPSFGVLGRRLLDERRHACHDQVPPAPTVTTAMVEAHLRCDGLLRAAPGRRSLSGARRRALAVHRRWHMVPGAARLDPELAALFSSGSRERDFRALLRALRERVADASGLLEDGSAAGQPGTVLGRTLDPREIRLGLARAAATPIAGPGVTASPDLLSRATEAAAQALGWTSPGEARRWFASGRPRPGRVALPLPPLPPYHRAHMDLRVEIDRGDVVLAPPDARTARRRQRIPTIVVLARGDDGREVALVRWPTTIGGWNRFEDEDGSTTLRYADSRVGPAVWRDLLATPTWYPPPGIPVRSLLDETPLGLRPRTEIIGPGYRAAYGLVALVHEEPPRAPRTDLVDRGIRTHGTPAYRSVGRGNSHGCHRLYNHLAVRLGSFLLHHREHVRHGAPRQRYKRLIEWEEQQLALESDHRGYRFELRPPVPVEVRAGRVLGSRAAVARAIPIDPPAAGGVPPIAAVASEF
jgi:hypothetical protein